MSHTPDHIHNPTCACTCHVEHEGKAEHIVYCPTHAASPDLLTACQAAFQRSCDRLNTRHGAGWTAADQQVHAALIAAIDKAEGTDSSDASREIADAARHNADALRQHETKGDR